MRTSMQNVGVLTALTQSRGRRGLSPAPSGDQDERDERELVGPGAVVFIRAQLGAGTAKAP